MIAYVAGPLPFTEGGRLYLSSILAPALRKAGFKPTATWDARTAALAGRICLDAEEDRKYVWRGLLNGQWEAGKEGMDRADLVVAILDGAPPDGRLKAEVEYAVSRGKQVVGLSTDSRRSPANPEWRADPAEALIMGSGGRVVTSLAELVEVTGVMAGPQRAQAAATTQAPRGKRSKTSRVGQSD